MTEQNLAPFEGDAPGQPAAKPAKEPVKDELGEVRRELADLRKRNAELSDSEKYWADRARAGGGAPADPEPDDETEVEEQSEASQISPDDFLDLLTKDGPEAVAKELSKRGFVKKADVAKLAESIAQRVVDRERGKITSDAKLISDYPELRDEKSALFIETGKVYRELVATDPKLHKSPATLLLAAKYAKQELALRAGASRRPGQGEDPDDYRDRDDERTRRARAQQGDTGRGRGGPAERDDEDLGDEARQVIAMFAKAGVDEKAYRDERTRLRDGRRRG